MAILCHQGITLVNLTSGSEKPALGGAHADWPIRLCCSWSCERKDEENTALNELRRGKFVL